tara:strand:- start:378 stop:1322 length:945 start_codon:yes stop_codon:yes gene_type:complete
MENTQSNPTLDSINDEINSEIEKVKQKGTEDLEIELVEKPVEEPVVEEKKQEKKDPADVTEEEKKKYSEDVQKRIKKVLAQKHEAEAKSAELLEQVSEMKKRLEKIETSNEKQGQNQLREHYDLTKKALAKAIEEGDTEAQIKFTEELGDLKTTLAVQRLAKEQGKRAMPTSIDTAQQTSKNPPPQLAMRWWQDNKWFNSKGYDQETAYARSIDVQLDIEGYDKNTPEYYSELNNRLQKKYPELISIDEVVEDKPRAKSRQAVAPTTGGSGYRGNRIRMSQQELAMARELGITDPDALKKYAKEIQTLKNRRDS